MSKLYVGNLPYRASEADVESLFSQFGSVVNVILIKDRDTGRPKGFGFVEFQDAAAAQQALSLDGKEFQERALKVSMARERANDDRGDRGGDRGDRGGRGGMGGGRGAGAGAGDRGGRRW